MPVLNVKRSTAMFNLLFVPEYVTLHMNYITDQFPLDLCMLMLKKYKHRTVIVLLCA